jgi:hypothetical protein
MGHLRQCLPDGAPNGTISETIGIISTQLVAHSGILQPLLGTRLKALTPHLQEPLQDKSPTQQDMVPLTELGERAIPTTADMVAHRTQVTDLVVMGATGTAALETMATAAMVATETTGTAAMAIVDMVITATADMVTMVMADMETTRRRVPAPVKCWLQVLEGWRSVRLVVP